MYLVAFSVAFGLALFRIRKNEVKLTLNDLESFFSWAILGVLIGGRLGYVLFYNLPYFLDYPLEIILPVRFTASGMVFTGYAGMSYHGGMIGVAVAFLGFALKRGVGFAVLTDAVIPGIPLGFMFGRFGCFINGVLYGRPTASPIGMVFPMDPLGLPRHPSQLYEALGEGLFLFIVLWAVRNRPAFRGRMAATYLVGFGLVRFLIEFFREPDPQLGFVLGPFTMGQILSSAMAIAGLLLFLAPVLLRPLEFRTRGE